MESARGDIKVPWLLLFDRVALCLPDLASLSSDEEEDDEEDDDKESRSATVFSVSTFELAARPQERKRVDAMDRLEWAWREHASTNKEHEEDTMDICECTFPMPDSVSFPPFHSSDRVDLLSASSVLIRSDRTPAQEEFEKWMMDLDKRLRLEEVKEVVKDVVEQRQCRLLPQIGRPWGYDLCLCMMVRNEAHIVLEALRSLVSHIDCWCVVDTGSVDDTQELIQGFFTQHGKPGVMVERPWVDDFGASRTEAFRQCLALSRFVLVFDADNVLRGRPRWPNWSQEWTTTDGYSMRLIEGRSADGHSVLWRTTVFRNDGTWFYHGVLHEQPQNRMRFPTIASIRGRYHIESRRLGARGRDPHRGIRDCRVLEQALVRTPADPWIAFYLARAYFDYSAWNTSIVCFQHLLCHVETRPTLLAAEAWRYIGKAHAASGRSELALAAFYHSLKGQRPPLSYPLESHYHIIHILRVTGRDDEAWSHVYRYMTPYVPFSIPDIHGMLLDTSLYTNRAYEEMALCAAATGHFSLALEWISLALQHKKLDSASTLRLRFNAYLLLPHMPRRRLRMTVQSLPELFTPLSLTLPTLSVWIMACVGFLFLLHFCISFI